MTAYPIDMRNAGRTTTYDVNGVNRQGVGIGSRGGCASTLTREFVPVAAITSMAYDGWNQAAIRECCITLRAANSHGDGNNAVTKGVQIWK